MRFFARSVTENFERAEIGTHPCILLKTKTLPGYFFERQILAGNAQIASEERQRFDS